MDKITISVKRGDDKLLLTFDEDLPLFDAMGGESWVDIMKVILTWVSFPSESIDNIFAKEQ